jgi:hypothetical protein
VSDVIGTTRRPSLGRLAGVLFSRLLLFLLFDAVIAAVFALAGAPDPWDAAVAWWPLSVTLGNVGCLLLLRSVLRAEGLGLASVYGRFARATWKVDLLWVLGAVVVSAVLVQMPSALLSLALWGDTTATLSVMFRPLPLGAIAVLCVAFPVSVALTELPLYFGYVLPRLRAATGRRWLPIVAVAAVLSLQHVALPLVFDWRIMLWRSLMYAPFALWVGWLLDHRRSLMPYMIVVHGLLDVSVPVMVLLASMGVPLV